MFCHNCGSIIDDWASACRHCGVAVTPVAPAPGATPPPPPPPGHAAPPPLLRSFCRACGSENPPAAVRCLSCGLELEGPRRTAASQVPGSEDQPRWIVAVILAFVSFFNPIHGLARFYTGHVGIGLFQLLTFGGCWIWTTIDIVLLLTDNFRDAQGRRLRKD